MPSLSKSNVISLFSSAISDGNSALWDSFSEKDNCNATFESVQKVYF